MGHGVSGTLDGMKRKLIAVALLLLTALLFAPAGVYEFLNWDDPDFVTENNHVRQGLTADSVRWALTTNYIYWQPLVFLSHMAMVSLYGLNPGPHHLLNVALHAMNAALWFVVLGRLRFSVWTAAIAAALWAWHPLRVESVAWVTERKDVLSGLFWILTIWAYTHYAAHRKDWRRFALVTMLFALALATKPVAVTLPLLLLMLDRWPLERLDESTIRARIIEKLPLFALSAISALITILGQQSVAAVSSGVGFGARALNAVRSYAVYLLQTVWPDGLSPFYTFPVAHPVWEIVASAALLAGVSWLVWKRRKLNPWWMLAWAWYLVVLLPNIGFLQVGEQSHADRYTYLPTTMLIAGACFGISRLNSRMAGFIGAAACIALFLCSVVQITYWKNNFALYDRMLEVDPRTPLAYNNLGLLYAEKGQLREALRHYEAAVSITPAHYEARVGAVNAYLATGEPGKALAHAEAMEKLEPGRPETFLHLGRALAGVNRLEEAKAAFQKGLGLAPIAAVKAPLYMQLGVVEYMAKNDEGALAAFRGALAADPQHWPARKNAGIVLGNMGRTAEAVAEFEAYLRANPGDKSVVEAVAALKSSGGR